MGWKKMGDEIWVGGDGRKVGWDDGREEGIRNRGRAGGIYTFWTELLPH